MTAGPDGIREFGPNHSFRHVKNVSALEKRYLGPIAAPEAIKLAGDWLDARLHP